MCVCMVCVCVCVCVYISESSDSKMCPKFLPNRCWTNTLKGNKATEPKPSFYAFCDKVSKEMYQFFSLCEHDVKGRSGKLYSGINIPFLPLSLLSLRTEWRKGNERKTHFANHCNQLLIDAVFNAFWVVVVQNVWNKCIISIVTLSHHSLLYFWTPKFRVLFTAIRHMIPSWGRWI